MFNEESSVNKDKTYDVSQIYYTHGCKDKQGDYLVPERFRLQNNGK